MASLESVVSPGMTHNGSGLLLCWYSVIRQPKQLLSKDTEDENIFCSSALFVQPGQMLISDLQTKIYSSASIAANRPVVGMAFVMPDIINVQTILITSPS